MVRTCTARRTQRIRHAGFGLLGALALFSSGFAQSSEAASVHEIVSGNSDFSIFRAALTKTALWPRLESGTPVTLLLPSDQAMENEGSAFLLRDVLITEANRERLINTLSYHVHFGLRLIPSEISELELHTETGSCVYLYRMGATVRIAPDATVIRYIPADDGAVFVIDRLLWQPWAGGTHCPDRDELG